MKGTLRDGNYLQVLVNGRAIRALLDSGASRSSISEKFAKVLRVNMESETKDHTVVFTADGRTMTVFGQTTVNVKIN